jgi:hypothetical protein
MANHHHRGVCAKRINGAQDMLDDQTTGERVKHLWPRRLHSRAFAGREDDHVKGH